MGLRVWSYGYGDMVIELWVWSYGYKIMGMELRV